MNLQKIVRFITIGSLFLIPVFPLIVANTFFFPFITGKAFYFRILVEVAFAGWLILAFLDARYRPRFTPLTITVTLFALVTLVADLIGINPLRSIWSNFERMEGWLVIAHLWAFFIATVHMFGHGAEGRHMWHRWFNTSLGIAGIVGIYGFFQLFGWADIHQGSTRIDASLGNAIYMAVYMLIHAFLAAYLFFVTREHKGSSGAVPKQWMYGIASVVFAFLLFQTATRGTILALIGGVGLSLLIYSIFGKKEPKKFRLISVGIIAAIILVAGIFWVNRDAQFVKNSEVLNRLATISLSENKTQARGYIWPMAIEGFKERPILGWGQENFNYIFNANYNPEMWSQEQWFDRAHNVYLDWLTAAGAVGLLTYLALYVFAFIGIWKSSLNIKEKSILTGLVAAYAVHNVFVFDNLASYVLFFVVLGFINTFTEGKPVRIFGSKPMRVDAVEYIVAPIVLILLVAGVYFLNVRPIQANKGLIVALSYCAAGKADAAHFDKVIALNQTMANQETREQILACTGNVLGGQYPGPTKMAFATLVSKEIDKQIAAAPNDARVYALAGSFYNSIGQFELAISMLDKAWNLSPGKQSIGMQLVNAYVNNGKTEEAIVLIKEMYEKTPSHTEVKNMYVRVLVFAGREAEVKTIFGDEATSLLENDQIAQIYASQKKYTQALALFKKLAAADPKNINLRAQIAQTYFAAGMRTQAAEALRSMIPDFPEYKAQIEASIIELQKQP
jgi:pentatricopeptide repeat protein